MPVETLPDTSALALRSAAVAADLTGRGLLAVAGADAATLLHGLVTNDVLGLRPGGGCHAALLTPRGKMRADLGVLRVAEEELLLECEASLASPLASILSGYVPFSRSRLADLTAETGVVQLEGPAAPGVLRRAGLTEPGAEAWSHAEASLDGTSVRVVRVSRAGGPGFTLLSPRAGSGRLLGVLVSSGAERADAEALEAGRIEAGLPRWGAELDETVLPNEAWLERTAISYTKGCYLGQETVARLRTYGHVNRHLVALLLPSGSAVHPGAVVRSAGEPVGRVTSAADSAARGRRVALAYVRRELEAPGTLLHVETGTDAVEGLVAAVPLAV